MEACRNPVPAIYARESNYRLDLTGEGADISSQRGQSTLFSVYDFGICEPTFDVMKHLFSAEAYRQRHGFDSLHIIFAMADTESGPHRLSTKIYGEVQCEWRLKNSCLAAVSLLQKSGVSVCRRRAQLTSLI